MFKRTLTAAAVVLMSIAGCTSNEATMGKKSTMLSDKDNKFLVKLAQSNMTEIQSSQLATSMASSQDVKDFARMMIQDHQQAGEKAMTVASGKGAMMPTMLDDDHAKMVDSLKGKSGADFDKGYMELQIKAHDKTVDFVQEEANNGDDMDVKGLANTLLPTLKGHDDHAKMIQHSMGM